MKSRIAQMVVLACTLLMVLVSTQTSLQSADHHDSPEDAIPVVFWHVFSGPQSSAMEQLIAEFEAVHPNIDIQPEYHGSYDQLYGEVVTLLQEGGSLPDLVIGYPNHFAEYARYEGLRFLDDFASDPVGGLTNIADIYTATLESNRLLDFGYQLGGLPLGQSIEVMFYNGDLLAAHSLAIPQTWEQFSSTCTTIADSTMTGAMLRTDASHLDVLVWSRGGELVSSDFRHATFNEAPGVEALQLYRNLLDNGCAKMPEYQYHDFERFVAGQAGFVFGSSAGLPFYQSQIASTGTITDWGVAHVPALSGYEAVERYGPNVAILASTPEREGAAWQFIKWLNETDQTARWAADAGYFPVRLSASTHPSITTKLATDPQWAQAFAMLSLGRAAPGLRGWQEARTEMKTAMEAVLIDGKDIAISLEVAAENVDVILAARSPVGADIAPSGGMLIYNPTAGFTTTIDFPEGAIAVTQTVSLVPAPDLPLDGFGFALVPSLILSQPVTITVYYRDDDLIGMDETSLHLYQYDRSMSQWVEAGPCGGYDRDPANNVFKAVVCHFSEYGLADWMYSLHLPSVVQS